MKVLCVSPAAAEAVAEYLRGLDAPASVEGVAVHIEPGKRTWRMLAHVPQGLLVHELPWK